MTTKKIRKHFFGLIDVVPLVTASLSSGINNLYTFTYILPLNLSTKIPLRREMKLPIFITNMFAFIVLSIMSILSVSDAFSINTMSTSYQTAIDSSTIPNMSTTTTAPPREKTKRKTRRGTGNGNGSTDDDRSTNPNEIVRYNDAPMEYLEDEWSTRNPDDPFHILLLDTTFTQNDRVTIPYVAGCLTYVLGMPEDEATDLSKLSMLNGFSCLGTWEREECLKLGRQLQIRDCVVRVVPFVEGGSRGWQAKDASAAGGSSSDFGSGFE